MCPHIFDLRVDLAWYGIFQTEFALSVLAKTRSRCLCCVFQRLHVDRWNRNSCHFVTVHMSIDGSQHKLFCGSVWRRTSTNTWPGLCSLCCVSWWGTAPPSGFHLHLTDTLFSLSGLNKDSEGHLTGLHVLWITNNVTNELTFCPSFFFSFQL